jgi:hypothetical protein
MKDGVMPFFNEVKISQKNFNKAKRDFLKNTYKNEFNKFLDERFAKVETTDAGSPFKKADEDYAPPQNILQEESFCSFSSNSSTNEKRQAVLKESRQVQPKQEDRAALQRRLAKEREMRYKNFVPFTQLMQMDENLRDKFEIQEEPMLSFAEYKLRSKMSRSVGAKNKKIGLRSNKHRTLIMDCLETNSKNAKFYTKFMKEKSEQQITKLLKTYQKTKKLEQKNHKNLTIKQPKKTVISNLNYLKKKDRNLSNKSYGSFNCLNILESIHQTEKPKQHKVYKTLQKQSHFNKNDHFHSYRYSSRRLTSQHQIMTKEQKIDLLEKRAAFFDECEDESELVTKASLKLQKQAAREMGNQRMRGVNPKERNFIISKGVRSLRDDEDGAGLVQEWMKSVKKLRDAEIEKLGEYDMNQSLSLEISPKFNYGHMNSPKKGVKLRQLMDVKTRTVVVGREVVREEPDYEKGLEGNVFQGYKPGSREGAVMIFMRFLSEFEAQSAKFDREKGVNLVYLGGSGCKVYSSISVYSVCKLDF